MLSSHQENAKEESETEEGCTQHGKAQPGESFRAGINFINLYNYDYYGKLVKALLRSIMSQFHQHFTLVFSYKSELSSFSLVTFGFVIF